MSEHTRGVALTTTPARSVAKGPLPERRGVPSVGRIVTLLIGQSYGYIRLAENREVYFHRSDLDAGTSFNEFTVGDAVSFELLEDAVSGARALRVRRRQR